MDQGKDSILWKHIKHLGITYKSHFSVEKISLKFCLGYELEYNLGRWRDGRGVLGMIYKVFEIEEMQWLTGKGRLGA